MPPRISPDHRKRKSPTHQILPCLSRRLAILPQRQGPLQSDTRTRRIPIKVNRHVQLRLLAEHLDDLLQSDHELGYYGSADTGPNAYAVKVRFGDGGAEVIEGDFGAEEGDFEEVVSLTEGKGGHGG